MASREQPLLASEGDEAQSVTAPEPMYIDNTAAVGAVETRFRNGSVMQSVELTRTLSMQLDEETAAVQHKAGLPGCIFNYTNSIIGAGIIGLPYALKTAGFWYGILLLLFVAVLIDYGVRHLIECGVQRNKMDYELIVEHLFGKTGYYAVTIFMFLFAYGAMVAYHIVIGDVMTPLVAFASGHDDELYNQRWFIITIYSIIFMLPLSLLKNMSALSWTSGISITAVLVIVLSVMVQAPISSNDMDIDHDRPIPFIRSRFFEAIGTMSFAFVCHHNSFIVYNSLSDASKSRWKIVSNGSVGISLVLSLMLSIAAYLSFRDDTDSDILNNFEFDNPVISASRVLLAMTMVFTFPMEQFVSRHCVMEILESVFHSFSNKDVNERSRKYLTYFYGVTAILWSTSLIIGASAKDLGFVLALNGSVCASSLGYIIPALVIIKTNGLWQNRQTEWKSRQFLVAFFMLVFGVVALFAGTITTIAGLWE